MKNDLISIIIPIYNVEEYLNRCVESIVKQTYKNIEIILVDDGSPDKCPTICEEWKKNDIRIKVVHKKNGGLSDARNEGLKISTGQYICFVDSDDYVAENFVEKLYFLIKKFNTDLAAVGICEFDKNKVISSNIEKENVEIYSGEDAIKELFFDRTYSNYAWNKMYKKSLFEVVKFPINRKMEDLGTTYKIILDTNKIVYTNEKLYFYYQRDNSILHSINYDFYKDKFELSYQRYKDINDVYPDLKENKEFILKVIFQTYKALHNSIHWFDWKNDVRKIYKSSEEKFCYKVEIKYWMYILKIKVENIINKIWKR